MEIPRRSLADATELRALAHPTRLRILEFLQLEGPLTATEAAERVGESPANCSWHLRQLARYGFVEETRDGVGRQRPWRARLEVQNFDATEGDAGQASIAASTAIHERELDALRQWHQARSGAPEDWRDAGFDLRAIAWLTPTELAEVAAMLTDMIMRFAERAADPDGRPRDARPVRLVAWGAPDARTVTGPASTA